MCLLDEILILQGVKQTIQPLEVGYANRPKKGGHVVFPPICGPAWLLPNNLCDVIFQVPLTGLQNSDFWAFGWAHGSGYMGHAATTWVPMGAQVPILPPNDHPNPSQGRQKGFGKS